MINDYNFENIEIPSSHKYSISLRLSQSFDFFFFLFLTHTLISIMLRNHDAAERKSENGFHNLSPFFFGFGCRIVKIVTKVYYGANSRDELVRLLLTK